VPDRANSGRSVPSNGIVTIRKHNRLTRFPTTFYSSLWYPTEKGAVDTESAALTVRLPLAVSIENTLREGGICMARGQNVWGIDIGKCGLKALLCSRSADTGKLVAEAFDYIEYPMLLTQPEADPAELVRDAVEEFLSRNEVAGNRVAVSVPGQAGLSKFIKLPPVEAAKIPDIVTYEARQQIPFPLDQVVWSWQRLEGGIEESGFVIDAEVALFAMKRDQVDKALEPFRQADIDVDLLQLSPVALANLIMADRLPPASEIDPESPPPSIVLASMGVDSTDLIITNGLRIWQRTMPIGGNNFTRSLVQGLRMTFPKAEKLKRNAARAEDPKKVFQTLRPVFNDFASEMQRSLNYFTGQDATAKIGGVILVGNAAKLRGLSDFLSKQLQLEVHRLHEYRNLEGQVVMKAPAFKENHLAFATAYGLVLQGLGLGSLRTNLLPPEVTRDRLIESKKPWAVVAMLGLLVAALVNFLGIFVAWNSYSENLFAKAFQQIDQVAAESASIQSGVEQAQSQQNEIVATQQRMLRLADQRFQALELMRAIEQVLPREEPDKTQPVEADAEDEEKSPEKFVAINYDELHIESIECEYFEDLSTWFEPLQDEWQRTIAREQPADEGEVPAAEELPASDAAPDAQPSAPDDSAEATADDNLMTEDLEDVEPVTPTGNGWVIQLTGYHFHNEDRHKPYEGRYYLQTTIVKNLLGEGVELTVAAGPNKGEPISVAELGIGFPVIVSSSRIRPDWLDTDVGGNASGQSGVGRAPSSRRGRRPRGRDQLEATEQDGIELKRYEFVLQFVWQPRSPGALELVPTDSDSDGLASF
jgi:type IV pilus assembly protein PilM